MEPKELGERIRTAREAKGISQDELAVLISRDQKSVSEYENGKRRIYAHDLPTFATALSVPISYFYGDTLSSDDLDAVILELLHQLDLDTRKQLIDVIRPLTLLLRRE